jgi:hypothetical protein
MVSKLRMVGVVLGVWAAACGGGGGSTGGGSTSSGAGGGGGATGACSEADLEACSYPGRKLAVTEVNVPPLTDMVTGRVLPLLARIPKGEGPMPLVIWSHGGGFNDKGHQLEVTWGEALSTHGYAVLHVGHSSLDVEAGKKLCELGGIPVNECGVSDGEDTTGTIALVKTRDVIAVLDALPALSMASVDAGGRPIDLDRVVVGGWSAGSRAPLITHGAVFYPSPSAKVFSMAHPLPVAAIALSPIGPGYAGFFDDGTSSTWSPTRGPIFVGTGDNDIKAEKPDLLGKDRRIAFEKQPADGTRWLLYSKLPAGVGAHGTYDLGDIDSADPRLARLSSALVSSVRAFLDANVLGDEAAKAWLATQNAAVLAGEADWVHK